MKVRDIGESSVIQPSEGVGAAMNRYVPHMRGVTLGVSSLTIVCGAMP
jgi:hypothetical protein